MKNNAFNVTDLRKLLALQRVFLEAKFCLEPNDSEISDSPIVAEMFVDLIEVLVNAEISNGNNEAEKNWLRWLKIDESRDEWKIAINRVQKKIDWHSFSRKEKSEYVEILFKPFILDSETIEKFICVVEK